MSPEWSRPTSSSPSPRDIFSQSLGWSAARSFWLPTIFLFFPLQLAPLNEYYFENIPDEAYLCRTAGYSGPASAARPLLLGVELDVAAPSWTRQTLFFLTTISALFWVNTVHFLLYIYPWSISKWHLTLCDLMHWSPLGSSFHDILRQEYWSGLPFPPPGDFPDLGVKTAFFTSPTLPGRFLTTVPPCKAV